MCWTGGVDPDQEMIDLRMNAIKHKILILSGKGGKTSEILHDCTYVVDWNEFQVKMIWN